MELEAREEQVKQFKLICSIMGVGVPGPLTYKAATKLV